MKTILSFGAGVNSTAILALSLLKRIPKPDYIVFSDTGAEYPRTYEYLDYLEWRGIKITYLRGGSKGMTLIDYCKMKKFIPSRTKRWCTDYWKIRPMKKFANSLNDNYKMLIGIDAGESHRAKNFKKEQYSPLLEMGITRNGCVELIKEARLNIPEKSGCFICPFQPKREWVYLKKYHPELWRIAVNLERKSMKEKEGFTFKHGLSLEEFVSDLDKQMGLFSLKEG